MTIESRTYATLLSERHEVHLVSSYLRNARYIPQGGLHRLGSSPPAQKPFASAPGNRRVV